VLVTIAPFDDVEVFEGSTLAQLRPHLAEATGRPELGSAPLTIEGIPLEPTQVCGHEPLLAGAIVHLGPSEADVARAATRAPWHVAVVDGPDAGHLRAPGPDGSVLVRGATSAGDPSRGSAARAPGAAVLAVRDPALADVEVRVRASRRSTRIRWRAGHRRWRVWRPGRDLALGASRLELRWRADREPRPWRRQRTRPATEDRRRERLALAASSVLPLVSSIGLAIALHSAALLLVGLTSAAALALMRRIDHHGARESGPHSGAVPAELDENAVRTPRIRSAEPAELSRWLAGPLRDPVWPGPSPALDLTPERCLGVVGSRDRSRAAVRAMVATAVARAEPRTLEVAVVGPGATAAGWGWARWLPAPVHLADDRLPDTLLDRSHHLPVLCISDGPLGPSAAAGLARWWHGAAPGSSLVLILDRAEERPAWCHAVLDVDDGAFVTPDGTTRPALTPGVSVTWAEGVARRLTGRRQLLGGAGQVHRPIALTDLPGLPRPDLGSIGDAWDAVGAAGAPELRAPLGTASGSRPVTLELSRDGPHVLIAGTTGAGKSELLQSLVISLAAQHSPAALVLALVDFKGGTSLGPCARLPHVTGRVSDLDPLLARRALSGLRAELSRREAILAEHGVADLDGLWRRFRDFDPGPSGAPVAGPAGGQVPAPLPRLVIVVDELRALVDDVPEAMPTIARIAAQGRALGMHLVLATQRPAGALSPDARANIGIRIALRVAEAADSLDVLGIPDAAQIPHDHPGQAVLRVATATPVPFQTARACGRAEDLALVRRVDAPPEPDPPAERPSPAEEWVSAVSAAGAARQLPRPSALWQPPLPEHVELEHLVALTSSADDDADGLAWGLADLVDEQRQAPAVWRPSTGNLVVKGQAGAGRTTALHTLAIAALRSGHDVHVISATPWRFADLAGQHGLGTVASASDGRLTLRLLELLRRGGASRQPGHGRASLDEHSKRHPAAPDRMPLLVLDDLPELARTLESRSRAAPDVLTAVLRASTGSGLAVAASSAPGHLGRDLSPYLPQRLVLGTGDVAAGLAGGVPRALAGVPSRPGLGVWLSSKPAVLVQVAQARVGSRRRTPTSSCSAAAPARLAPIGLRVLPADAGTPPSGSVDITELPLGIGGDTAQPVALDLSERCFLVVGPRGSGRSTVLAVLAAALLDRVAEALIVTRRGPLLALTRSGRPVRVTVTDRPRLEDIARAELLVLDDLDDLERGEPGWSDAICARRSADHTPGPFVLASASTERASLTFRGLLGELRRGGCGIVLGANTPGSGEVFAERIESQVDDDAGHPGRGVLLSQAGAVPLQVFRAS